MKGALTAAQIYLKVHALRVTSGFAYQYEHTYVCSMWLASLSDIVYDSLDDVYNEPVSSCFCSFLYTQVASDASKVADRPTVGEADGPKPDKASHVTDGGTVAQNDSKPVPYRDNHKKEDLNDKYLYGNGQDGNDEEDDLNPEEKDNDDVMEEVFNAEQQRRMDLLGDAEPKEI